MALKDGWRSFRDVVSILTDTIGSNLIAWDDLENHLISGRIKSKANFNRLHELTGAIIKTEERILKSDWWQTPGRFGRLSGKLVLYSKIESHQINGWPGIRSVFDNPASSWTDIMLWIPNVCALYPGTFDRSIAADVGASQSAYPPSPVTRQRGPKSSVSERVKAEMRLVPAEELREMKMVEMEARFRASFDTCTRARKAVISEFFGD